MPRPHPKEFRDDVVAIAYQGDATVSQIARDCGVSDSCLRNSPHAADVEDGNRPDVTASESAELRELSRRNRLLEYEYEVVVLRRAATYLYQAHVPEEALPARRWLAGDGFPVAVTCRVPKLARQPSYRWLAADITACELDEAYLADVMSDAQEDDPGPTGPDRAMRSSWSRQTSTRHGAEHWAEAG